MELRVTSPRGPRQLHTRTAVTDAGQALHPDHCGQPAGSARNSGADLCQLPHPVQVVFRHHPASVPCPSVEGHSSCVPGAGSRAWWPQKVRRIANRDLSQRLANAKHGPTTRSSPYGSPTKSLNGTSIQPPETTCLLTCGKANKATEHCAMSVCRTRKHSLSERRRAVTCSNSTGARPGRRTGD